MVNAEIQFQISKVALKIAGFCWIFRLVRTLLVLKAQVRLMMLCFSRVCAFFLYFFFISKSKFIDDHRLFASKISKSYAQIVYALFTVEELTCLATWKDGNSRYLVGLVSHHHAVSNEERYRCFVYEKILSNGKCLKWSFVIRMQVWTTQSNKSMVFIKFMILGETTKDAEYKLAQSGDATCNGLDSAEVRTTTATFFLFIICLIFSSEKDIGNLIW